MYRIIQTKAKYPGLHQECLRTQNRFEELGYYSCIINVSEDNRTFVKTLMDILEDKNSSEYFMIGFDDLYYTYNIIPAAAEIEDLMTKLQLHYLRCDARPQGKGEYIDKSQGGVIELIGRQRYVYSTVNSVFSKSLLVELNKLGCKSAWDIENLAEPILKSGVLLGRRCRYENLLVRGVIDPTAISRTPLGLDLKSSVFRALKKVIADLFTNG